MKAIYGYITDKSKFSERDGDVFWEFERGGVKYIGIETQKPTKTKYAVTIGDSNDFKKNVNNETKNERKGRIF